MQKLHTRTNTYTELAEAFVSLYERTTDKNTPIRRIGVSFNRLEPASLKQLSLFEDNALNLKEEKLERALVFVKSKMGPNSILKGMNLEEGATQLIRNKLVGGHNAM
jgi:DNA polymerase V